MSVLDAFYSTWSRARETFGEGTPQDGAQLDAGASQLQQMKAGVEAAAPDSRWQGPASEAYAAKNKQHAAVYEKLAGLDKRMAAEITNAANVVTKGRRNLDEVKSWVTSAAASIPASTSAEDRDRKLLPIAKQGISQISEIIQQSTGQMQEVSNRIQGVKSEYDALANKKLGPELDKLGGDKDSDRSNYVGEEGEKADGELKPEDMQQLVHDALQGDSHAASEVDRIMNTIDEDQMGPNSVAHPLNPLQAELVGQMQAQMKNMPMDRLNALRDKLGPNKKILANAMQIMRLFRNGSAWLGPGRPLTRW